MIHIPDKQAIVPNASVGFYPLVGQGKLQLIGWLLFIVSAVLFIASAIQNGDWLAGLGGLFFLVACIVFLIPLLSRRQ